MFTVASGVQFQCNHRLFDLLDFLAEVTQHIPNAGEHLIRYYGWYSNKSRGQRAKTLPPAVAGTGLPGHPPTAREARKGWAALVKQVYEAEPLSCPLSVASCPLSVVRCQLAVGRWPLAVVRWPLSVGRCQLAVLGGAVLVSSCYSRAALAKTTK